MEKKKSLIYKYSTCFDCNNYLNMFQRDMERVALLDLFTHKCHAECIIKISGYNFGEVLIVEKPQCSQPLKYKTDILQTN